MLRDGEVVASPGRYLTDSGPQGTRSLQMDELATKYAPLPGPVVAVLLEWLPEARDTEVQEQVVRALGASGVAFDGDALVMLFRITESGTLRYAIANTLAQAPVRGVGTWLLKAVENPEYGTARQMLALAAARHNASAVANPVLVGLLAQIPGHAALALSETGGQNELEALEHVYANASGWVKQEIGRAISVVRRRLTEAK